MVIDNKGGSSEPPFLLPFGMVSRPGPNAFQARFPIRHTTAAGRAPVRDAWAGDGLGGSSGLIVKERTVKDSSTVG